MWRASAVIPAHHTGLLRRRISANRDITQAQFAVIAIRFANETPGGTSLFSDANEDDWFCTQVTSAAQYGWIGGFFDGTFRPYILSPGHR